MKGLFLLLKLLLIAIIGEGSNNNLYYANSYYLTNVIIQKDSSINGISILNKRISNSDVVDSSFFNFKDYVSLNYEDIDKIMSAVYNKAGNVVSLNRHKHNPFYKCWLVNAYRDHLNRINVLIKVVEVEEMVFYKVDLNLNMGYSNYYLFHSDWNDSNSVLYLVKDVESLCESRNTETYTNNSTPHASAQVYNIDFLNTGSVRYPDVKIFNILSDLLGYDEEQVKVDWQSNYYTHHQLDTFELYLLDLKIRNAAYRRMNLKNLVGLAYKDRYGRIDVYLYRKSKGVITTATKQEWYSFMDLHSTLSNCGTRPLFDYKYLRNFEL